MICGTQAVFGFWQSEQEDVKDEKKKIGG